MRTAVGAYRNASMRGRNLHVQVAVAHGVANLIVNAARAKHGEGTGVGNVTRKRKTCGNINHVLLGNAAVEQALGVFRACLRKLLRGGRAGQVGVNRNNGYAFCGELCQRYAERRTRSFLLSRLLCGGQFNHCKSPCLLLPIPPKPERSAPHSVQNHASLLDSP